MRIGAAARQRRPNERCDYRRVSRRASDAMTKHFGLGVCGMRIIANSARTVAVICTAVCGLFNVASRDAQADPIVTSISPNSGPSAGGTEVMIVGSQYRIDRGLCSVGNVTVPRVMFGRSNSLNVLRIDNTHVRATSPPGSGTVEITVTTQCEVGGATSTSAPSAAGRFSYSPR